MGFDVLAGGADVAAHEQLGHFAIAVFDGGDNLGMFGKRFVRPTGGAGTKGGMQRSGLAASTAAAILSVSPMLRRVRAREAPGIGGTNGAAPGASTRAS